MSILEDLIYLEEPEANYKLISYEFIFRKLVEIMGGAECGIALVFIGNDSKGFIVLAPV